MARVTRSAWMAASLVLVSAAAEALPCTDGTTCVHVEYAVSGNVDDVDFGPFIDFTGSAILEYQAEAEQDVQAGPVHLVELSESAQLEFSSPGIARMTGTAQIDAAASQSGSLLFPGAAQPDGALLLGTLLAQSIGFVHCFDFTTPSPCASIGQANSTPDPFSTMISTILDLVGTAGNRITAGLLDAPHTLTFVNVTPSGTITTVFTEVSRTFVPEPATGSLVALGLAGLGLAGSLGSRRRGATRVRR